MYLSPILYKLTIIVSVLMFFIVLLIGLSIMVLKHFPTSKVSTLIRKHIITDEDLEPKV